MNVSILPPVNAGLNALASVFLAIGFYCIRRKRIQKHRAMMISAVITSGLFLVSYLTYHFNTEMVTTFKGEGLARTLYFIILVSHSILAVAVPFLAAITLYRGVTMKVELHRRIARWTLPIWFYVSMTGVAVYVMLYHLYA